MATITTKLKLTKPDYNDVRDIKVLNDNADKIDKFATDIETKINNNKSISDNSLEDLLLQTSIKDTVVSVTKDSQDRVSSIVHKRNDLPIRTDVFSYSDNTITETRTLNGKDKTLTFTYNLSTLETVVK